jgi:4'-phosphopantetheinyl transferase EntD
VILLVLQVMLADARNFYRKLRTVPQSETAPGRLGAVSEASARCHREQRKRQTDIGAGRKCAHMYYTQIPLSRAENALSCTYKPS